MTRTLHSAIPRDTSATPAKLQVEDQRAQRVSWQAKQSYDFRTEALLPTLIGANSNGAFYGNAKVAPAKFKSVSRKSNVRSRVGSREDPTASADVGILDKADEVSYEARANEMVPMGDV